MANSPQQRQKAQHKKAAKRKQKAAMLRQQSQHQAARLDSKSQIQSAAAWPVLETLLSRDWDAEGEIVQAVVARDAPNGRIAVGVFLIDLACLGVKNSFAQLFETHADYLPLRTSVMESQPMVSADLNLVAKIVREAVGYAANLGFRPNSDFRLASLMLTGADPDASPAVVPTGGRDGKPLFVAGPHDNIDAILLRLEDRLGPEGFSYVMPEDGAGGWMDGYGGDEEDEGEEGEEEEEEFEGGGGSAEKPRLTS